MRSGEGWNSTGGSETVVNRSEALEGLTSTDQHVRLSAARYFRLAGEQGDLAFLQAAFDSEEVGWIRYALGDALHTASRDLVTEVASSEEEDRFPDDLYRKALGEATRTIVHEVRPLLGRLKLAAATEITDYPSSRTAERILQLGELMAAIDSLRQATEAPRLEEFELGEWVRTVVDDELNQDAFPESVLVGMEHVVAVGDRGLLQLVLSNALRNAREANLSAHPSAPPAVLISWGDTDRDYWVSVSDGGGGPPPGRKFAFRPGHSTKAGHLGMGLAVARAAMGSLSGQIQLARRENTAGANLEFRWPKPRTTL